DTEGELPKDVPTVGSNNWHGGLAATSHLIELGHRRIAMISGPSDVLCSRARVDGYRSAHDNAGVATDPALVRWGDFSVSAGYEHGLALLSLPERPTAIFAGSDRSEEHTSELQSRENLVCRLLLEKKNNTTDRTTT